ncbi:MAG: CNP1-like family protein [Dechloromonas sp.]|nr:CNP1-like family protein [Dechloromonas sp.]
MTGRCLMVLALATLPLVGAAAEFDEDYEAQAWQELALKLPPPPRAETLQSFYVSATTDHHFSIDGATLSTGADGVVRYVLVVETAGGARNVTYEGMRCETRERRVYASGRRDGTWSKARSNAWVRIQDVATNRHHAALFLEYLCPGGVIVRSPEYALSLLRRGGLPMGRDW